VTATVALLKVNLLTGVSIVETPRQRDIMYVNIAAAADMTGADVRSSAGSCFTAGGRSITACFARTYRRDDNCW
jgi:hypothetical protein